MSALFGPIAPVLAGDEAKQPVGTAFTYQGRLRQGLAPANGVFDLRFRLFSVSAGGKQISREVFIPGAQIEDGFFSVDLDFGPVYGGTKQWLEVQVNATTLFPRQALMPTPTALFALWSSP